MLRLCLLVWALGKASRELVLHGSLYASVMKDVTFSRKHNLLSSDWRHFQYNGLCHQKELRKNWH